MNDLKCLIAFYSRTGTTAKCPEAISAVLKADAEEIFDIRNRNGAFSYIKSSMDIVLRKTTVIEQV